MANKSDRRLKAEEKLPELFSDRDRRALTTTEIIEEIGVDLDRSIYMNILRENDRIHELKKGDVVLWILPRMRQFESLEQRVRKLEEEVLE